MCPEILSQYVKKTLSINPYGFLILIPGSGTHEFFTGSSAGCTIHDIGVPFLQFPEKHRMIDPVNKTA